MSPGDLLMPVLINNLLERGVNQNALLLHQLL